WESRPSLSLLLSAYHCEGLLLLLPLWACGQRSCVVHHVDSFIAERAGRALAPHCHRRPVAKRLMWALSIVKRKPRGDAAVRLAAVGIALQVDVLVLERAPQPFDEHVVHPTAAAVHRDVHPGGH